MTSLTHASFVPLIGGEAIGSEQAFGKRPEYILSYSGFEPNDRHLVHHYRNEVPYYLADEGVPSLPYVDVISSVCPCAGLSNLNPGSSADNPTNEWLYKTAKVVFENLKPQVYWGENAPTFASEKGAKIRKRMFELGKQHGYSMSVYRTKSLLHGLPQIRERSFYFFWKGDKVPTFQTFERERPSIEDLIRNVKSDFQNDLINHRKPTEHPYYRYVLEKMHPGMTHPEFQKSLTRSVDVFNYALEAGESFDEIAAWMTANGYDRDAAKILRRKAKREAGLGFMVRTVVIPNDRIGAFVGYLPGGLAHPDEDRYLNYREAMSIMGLPEDFELLDPKNNTNHICQNVPVPVARDMAAEIIATLEGKREMHRTDYLLQRNHNGEVKFGFDEPKKIKRVSATLEAVL